MYNDSELLKAVEKLNNVIFDLNGDIIIDGMGFSFSSNGYYSAVTFNDWVIWCSENDGALYYDEGETMMSAYETIFHHFNVYMKNLDTIITCIRKTQQTDTTPPAIIGL